MFDISREILVRGVVTELAWKNPHSCLTLRTATWYACTEPAICRAPQRGHQCSRLQVICELTASEEVLVARCSLHLGFFSASGK
jgi:hypothetical protein